MVARSRPTTRRPNSRSEPKSPDSTPVTDERVSSELPGALRAKRTRITSISDSQRLTKRLKTDQNNALSKYKFPLRNRRLEDAPKTKASSVTRPVLLSSHVANATPTSTTTTHPTKSTDQTSTNAKPQKDVIKHQTKFVVPQQEERRKLRSKDGGSRSKSELAMFFNNYEQMLSLDPPKPETLTPKTQITLIDDLPESTLLIPHPSSDYDPFDANKPLHNAQLVDLTPLVSSSRRPNYDPLDAEIFYKAHRKAERAEKSARNSERERAQHEKVQLDRLLEGLKGPDWLKVMGISGVTESEKKLFEPKRTLFTREVTALIKKFEDWKEEEKRQKERKKQEMRETEVQGGIDSEDAAEDGEDEEDENEQQSAVQHSSSGSVSNYDGPADYTSHEVDALAARQLHQETTFTASGSRKKSEGDTSAAPFPPPPLPPAYQPFKSFYSKRHLRDAAVAGYRRGRAVTAFGEPVPELDDHDFELPPTILTNDAVRASSRRKRRQRRGSSDE